MSCVEPIINYCVWCGRDATVSIPILVDGAAVSPEHRKLCNYFCRPRQHHPRRSPVTTTTTIIIVDEHPWWNPPTDTVRSYNNFDASPMDCWWWWRPNRATLLKWIPRRWHGWSFLLQPMISEQRKRVGDIESKRERVQLLADLSCLSFNLFIN